MSRRVPFRMSGSLRLFHCFGTLCALLCACDVRRAVPVDDGGGGSALPLADGSSTQPSDGALRLPDAPLTDGPDLCDEPREELVLFSDARGNFELALRPGLATRAISVAGAGPATSAATVDHARIAAFFATRPASSGDPLAELAALESRLRAAPGLALTLRASGVRGASAEGDPDVKEAIWDLAASEPTDISSLRNRVLAVLLERAPAQLAGLPGPVERRSGNFVLTATLTLRPGQLTLSAVLAARDHYDADTGTDFAWIEDLGNGTALARSGRGLDARGCDRGPLQTQGQADILWVIDESGSMRDDREAIAQHAASFFAKAAAAGLDFRMGVTGMVEPGLDGAVGGKLCSKASANPHDEGGEDRFLSAAEQETFLACIRNPPYHESGTEFGLAAVREAIERHLPRADDEPGRIRREAKLAVVLVTDEAPQELKIGSVYQQRYGFLEHDAYGPTQCKLNHENAQQLDDYLRPWFDLLAGVSDPESAATVYLIGGTCGNGCQAEIPYGYQELVQRTGGHRADVCRQDLGATLQLIVDSIVAASSPRVLAARPISGSLRVTANGLLLPRSKQRGFRYSAATNALSFLNVAIGKGTQITASYSLFANPQR